MRTLTATAVILASMAHAAASPARVVAELERGEPSIDEVRRAALQHAGLDDHPEQSWSGRARLAGALPVMTLRATRESAQERELSTRSSGEDQLDLGDDQALTYEARAVWELDRLVFDEVELRALQTAQRVHRDRLQLLLQVTTVYFQRRKLLLGAALAPETDPGRAALQALAIEELTAQLDALTGGYFSRALQRRRPAGPKAPRHAR